MHDFVEDSEALRHEFSKPNSAHHSGDETSLRSSDHRTTMSTSRRQTLGGRCLRGVAGGVGALSGGGLERDGGGV